MNKIIIRSGLTSHQRFILIIFFIASFFMGILVIIEIASSSKLDISISDYISLFLFVLSLGVLILLLSKEGVIIDNKKLFSSQFLWGKPFFKSEIKLDGMTDISILNYSLSQKLVFISAANPDYSEKIRVSKIFLLNENHSLKRLVLSTKRKDHAELIANEIQKEFGLKHKKYNPPIRIKKR